MPTGNTNNKSDKREQAAKADHKSSTRPNPQRMVRLKPKQREQIDDSTIALCYWLIAARIVEEAEQHGDLDCPDPELHGDRQGDQG